MAQVLGGGERHKEEHLGSSKLKCEITKDVRRAQCIQLYNILYTVNTQQYQYSDIMYAVGYTVATCFDPKRSSSGQ